MENTPYNNQTNTNDINNQTMVYEKKQPNMNSNRVIAVLVMVIFVLISVVIFMFLGRNDTKSNNTLVVKDNLVVKNNLDSTVLPTLSQIQKDNYVNPFSSKMAVGYINPFSDYLNTFSLLNALNEFRIEYPITNLNNCSASMQCLIHCNNPDNKDACVSVAQEKGFYVAPVDFSDEAISASSKIELNCSSQDECRDYCSEEANMQKCTDYAHKYHLPGGIQELVRMNRLSKGKSILGCDSIESCRNFCEVKENMAQCINLLTNNNL